MSEETATETATGEEAFEFVEAPVFTIDYKGECAYEVKVSVPPANTAKKTEEMIGELKAEAELPGFRRGKAPLKLIEKKFSKHVKNEVRGKLVGEAFQKLVKDEELNPIGYPDIDGIDEDTEFKDEEPLEFTLKFEVAPRVELGKYRGVEVERPVVKIDKQDIDEAIKETLERNATFEAMKKNAKAKDGDQVVMDFKGSIDGEVFSGGSAENYPYILGSGRFFPEFEEALKGSQADSELSCEVTFPEDYFAEELRGKKADFAIKVHEIKRKKTPKLTDDVAKEIGYESEADMREKIEESLREASASQSARIAESRALEAVIQDSTFEISKSMIAAVAHDVKHQEYHRLQHAQLTKDEMEARVKQLEETAEETAIRNIKTMVTLNEIGEAEGVEVTDEDLEKEAQTMAKSMGMEAQVQAVAQYMFQGEQRNNYLDRIYRSKALAVIMDNAKITDKELTRDELDAAEAAESADAEDGDEA